MIPYSTQHVTEGDLAAVRDTLTSGWLTQGPAVPRFEAAFAAAHGVEHAVAMSSATAALHVACLALGIGPGSRVWTSPNSFVASANCALYCGASVDFVDIDPQTRNISVAALERKLATTPVALHPQLLIPVDFSGLPCDLAPLRALADRFGFGILEDASHAVGARYQGQPVGSCHADASVFSFHPVKIITTAEGGMVTTRDARLAEKLRLLRSHGITRDPAQMEGPSEGGWYYQQIALGFNYRMTDMQAALGVSQLERLSVAAAARRTHVSNYSSLLAGLPLKLPVDPADRESSWHLYVVEIDTTRCRASRAQVFAALRAAGIGVNVHYIPIHMQPYYRKLGFAPGQFPAAEAYYAQALSLPLFPQLMAGQQEEVAAVLRRALTA